MAKEKIEVDKSQLDEMMAKIERLEKAASKKRLDYVDSKNKDDHGKTISLRMLNGLVVTSWRMTKDLVEQTPSGVWKEDQQIEVTYEDGKKEKMTYVIFSRRYTALLAEVTSETKLNKQEDIDKYGDTLFKVETEDGKKYEIGSTFVN